MTVKNGDYKHDYNVPAWDTETILQVFLAGRLERIHAMLNHFPNRPTKTRVYCRDSILSFDSTSIPIVFRDIAEGDTGVSMRKGWIVGYSVLKLLRLLFEALGERNTDECKPTKTCRTSSSTSTTK